MRVIEVQGLEVRMYLSDSMVVNPRCENEDGKRLVMMAKVGKNRKYLTD